MLSYQNFFKLSQNFTKITITALVIVLFTSLINPLAARAEIKTLSNGSDPFDSIPLKLNVEKSHNDLGDSKDQSLNVKIRQGEDLPHSPHSYYLRIWDVDKNKFVFDSKYHWSAVKDINETIIIDEILETGTHRFRVFAFKNYQKNLTIDEIVSLAIGKSEMFELVREKPITIKIHSLLKEDFPWGGLNHVYVHLNQHVIDQSKYDVALYDRHEGKLVRITSYGVDKDPAGLLVSFTEGKTRDYTAVLLQSIHEGDHDYGSPRSWDEARKRAIAVSNTITVERTPWSVEVQEKPMNGQKRLP